MRDILYSAGIKQHISGRTHKNGHTLDLIISRECDDLVMNPFVIHGMPSDHSAVRCNLNVSRPKLSKQTVKFRKYKDIKLHELQSDILSSDLNKDEDSNEIDNLVEKYDSTLRELVDKHAPEVERSISLRPHAPWYNDSLREAKRKKRQLERKRIKGGCAHVDMCNLHSKLIDLDPEDTFCKILPPVYFLFSLLVQKQVCNTGDEAVMKIHKRMKIGIPEICTFSALTSKV